MQTSNPADGLHLAFYCTDPDSVPGEDCATFYQTNRGTWIVQGDRREEPDVVTQLVALKPSESSVEVPGPLVDLLVRRYAKERYGIDLG
ncbi:hypothetical protein HNR40_008673 [Nonomuraea endophytica]|uniref:Uncharacterized protein n=1 Tax=Nonomuraea endophytica TaxID=714136 RepID=A0A7W8EJH3_9ACTN|nr:hypothetical protein [Nonomuraea endophytica]